MRDRDLTEAMEGKWHEFSHTEEGPCGELQVCICGRKNYMMPCATPDFSTWQGFGLLWEWAQKQEWWTQFLLSPRDTSHEVNHWLGIVHPDRFADAVYEVLGGGGADE